MTDTEPQHVRLARGLITECGSVDITAQLSTHTGEPAGSSSSVVFKTGGSPKLVHVMISDEYLWQVPGTDHSHSLDLDTPAADVVELVAICFAGHCRELAELTRADTTGNSTVDSEA